MPLYALQTFHIEWFLGLGEKMCTVTGAVDYINSFAEWMSVAIVALTKCINLIKPKFGYKWFSGFWGICIIASIWIYANAMVIPRYFSKFDDKFGTFGYDCRTGKCDIIPSMANSKYHNFTRDAVTFKIFFLKAC